MRRMAPTKTRGSIELRPSIRFETSSILLNTNGQRRQDSMRRASKIRAEKIVRALSLADLQQGKVWMLSRYVFAYCCFRNTRQTGLKWVLLLTKSYSFK